MTFSSSAARSAVAVRWMVSPSGTGSRLRGSEYETSIALDESHPLERGRHLRGGSRWPAVHLPDLQRPDTTVLDQGGERIGPGRVLGHAREGDQVVALAVEPDEQPPGAQDHQ